MDPRGYSCDCPEGIELGADALTCMLITSTYGMHDIVHFSLDLQVEVWNHVTFQLV